MIVADIIEERISQNLKFDIIFGKYGDIIPIRNRFYVSKQIIGYTAILSEEVPRTPTQDV